MKLETDSHGRIQSLTPAAAALLNLSAQGAVGRSLLLFFRGGRPEIERQLRRACLGYPVVDVEALVAGRDRRAERCRISITCEDNGQIVWRFVSETPTEGRGSQRRSPLPQTSSR